MKDIILELKEQKVIIDKDVAEIYGIGTKRVNEAVKNNPEKFPDDYFFKVTDDELDYLRSKFSTAKFAKTSVNPNVFFMNFHGLFLLPIDLKPCTLNPLFLIPGEAFTLCSLYLLFP
ncbi:MAG: ORF6N domain-containing protein [Deltaproteobacteria bacterium]|nr:ORF6N domain-containing protein [Deltaproteobacteria bacterium]MBT4524926.1 ORF6N domain-containing protein [Deltaproteobacteria bacterium]